MKAKPILKKVLYIAGNVLLYVFIAVCLLGVILTVTAKRDANGTSTIFGIQMRIVLSPSMEKCELTDVSEFEIKDIPTGSMVFVETMPTDPSAANDWYSKIRVGDVLTFKYVYVSQETITHRVTAIREKDTGGYVIHLAGDNKNSDSNTLTQMIDTSVPNNPNYVIGKVVGQNYLLGLFASLMQSPLGLILVVIVPCLGIVIYEITKIVNMFLSGKREKEEAAHDERQRELEELRRRLAELEAQSNAPTPTAPVEEQDKEA